MAALVATAGTAAVLGGTSIHSAPSHNEFLSPLSSPEKSVSIADIPEAGYRGVENFCASGPLSGHVFYSGTEGQLVPSVLTVAIAGLPPNVPVYVDWSNNDIRGYIIASFKTDPMGTPIPSSVIMGRLAEVRGVEMVLEGTTVPPTVFGRLEPC
ncbi:MAG TPA: hypothetical protein VG244_09330 [Acidimicrobiales bacterium]|nr:hypothetical protein [Acidimicrobiales bacterium]